MSKLSFSSKMGRSRLPEVASNATTDQAFASTDRLNKRQARGSQMAGGNKAKGGGRASKMEQKLDIKDQGLREALTLIMKQVATKNAQDIRKK